VIEETDMHKSSVAANQEFKQYALAMHPVGRFGKPGEVASAVLWLCSDGATFVPDTRGWWRAVSRLPDLHERG
jgi:NAD(P)-dependent dehydrogenase (short-subunit alcohol dehydrogenase family)